MSSRPAAEPESSESVAADRLRRTWWVWGVGGLLSMAAPAVILAAAFGSGWTRWGLATLACLAFVLSYLYIRLPLNRLGPGEPLLPRPGVGNTLTVARGLLIAHLPGYLFLPEPPGAAAWMPALTFVLALILDYLDGFFARREGAVTLLGQALDIEFDGLAILCGAAVAVHYGRLPLVYLATVGAARYLFLLAGWVGRRLGRSSRPLPDSYVRRGLAVVSMELGAAALWPIAPAPLMNVAAVIIGVPFLAGFARDGLIHLDLLDPRDPRYLGARRIVVQAATQIAPPVLRLALLFLLAPRLLSGGFGYGPSVSAGVNLFGLTASWLGLALVLFGLAGRTGASLVVVAFGIHLALTGFSTLDVAAWGAAVAIHLLGTGPASLWAPERSLHVRRAGEPRSNRP